MDSASADKSLLTQDKLSLHSWGLPRAILQKYASKGIENIFPWQLECLTRDGVLSGRNIVYSAPTSAGKTMVAEILTLKTVLEKKKKAIIILPFISVVREKMLYFQNLLGSSGVRVDGFMGSHAPPGGLRSVHVAICTIEKANSLINRLLEDHCLDSIGCVVVDELHLLGDSNRGYLLELLLTKLKYMANKDRNLTIQIVGMSATLPNMADLAKWLDAALYITDFRPIPLTQYLKVNNSVYEATPSSLEFKYKVEPIVKFKSDPGDVAQLCLESLLDGHSVLVFCPTRNRCETCAQQIASEFRAIGYGNNKLGLGVRAQLNGEALSEVLEQLKRCPASLDQALGRSVAFGVAFHHAGLTMDERDIVEGAFRASVVRVLVATSTLSFGVNLPARRVLIKCPPRNNRADILNYRQMVGRAGRLGKDTQGESFLICNDSERILGEQLVQAELPPVESTLAYGDLSSSLKRAILEVIASGAVSTLEDMKTYANSTFLSSCDGEGLVGPLGACVEYLQTHEFVRVREGTIGPTAFAEACLAASLSPEMGLKLLAELHRARQCFVLETELHIIYQVTPFSVSEQWGQLDWLRVLTLWENLPISMKRVGELVGLEDRLLVRAVRGSLNTETCDQKLSIIRRFYTALALQDLVNEVPLPQVAIKFDCTKGMLQSLQQSASTFAGMVTQFSRRLGWSNIELLVGQFCSRLQYGAQRELLDLLRLDCLTAVQARALYTAGIQTLADLATSATAKLERALSRAHPFHSETESNEVNDKRCVWLVGHSAFSEIKAAELLVQEAREYLQRELGLKNASWEDSNSANISSGSSLADDYATRCSNVVLTQTKVTPPMNPTIEEVVSHLEKLSSSNINNLMSAQGKGHNEKSPIPLHSNMSHTGKTDSIKKESCQSHAKIHASTNVSVKESKRESLDMFDTSDNLENSEDITFETKQDGKGLECNYSKETMQQSAPNEKTELGKEINEESTYIVKNKDTKNENKTQYSFLLHDNITSTKSGDLIRTSTPIYSLTGTTNVIFESPLPNEQPDQYSHCTEMDANLGGDSLLEMSYSETGRVINEAKLLEENTRDFSLIELSTFLGSTKERKRKHSANEIRANTSKKAKQSICNKSVNVSQNLSDVHCTELQEFKVTSTNCSGAENINFSLSTSNYLDTCINLDSDLFEEDYDGHLKSIKQRHDSSVEIKNQPPINSRLDSDKVEDKTSFKVHLSLETSSDNMVISDDECGSKTRHCVKSIGLSKCSRNKSFRENKLPTSNNEQCSFNSNLKDNKHDHAVIDCSFSGNLNFVSNFDNILCENNYFKSDAIDQEPIISKKLEEVSGDNNCNFNNSMLSSNFCALLDNKDNLLEANCKSTSLSRDHSESYQNNVSLEIESSNFCVLLDNKDNLQEANCKSTSLFRDHSENYQNNDSLDIESSNFCALLDNKDNLQEANCKSTSLSRDHSEIYQNNVSLKIESSNFGALLDNKDNLQEANCKSTSLTRDHSERYQNNVGLKIGTCVTNLFEEYQKQNISFPKSVSKGHKEIKEHSKLSSDEDTILGTPVLQHKLLCINEYSLKRGKPQHCDVLLNSRSNTSLFKVPNSHPMSNSSKTLKIGLGNKKGNQPPLVDCKTDNNTRMLCDGLTNSFLETAFKLSFSRETSDFEATVESQGTSSQQVSKTVSTPSRASLKSMNTSNSPTEKVRKNELEVITITRNNVNIYREFKKNLVVEKIFSIFLSTKDLSLLENEGVSIGVRIVKKRPDCHYPCCHGSRALTSVCVYWGETAVYSLPLDHNNYESSLEILQEVVKCRDVTLCIWEAKSAVVLLQECCRLTTDANLCDPTVAHWLLQPHANTPTMKQMARMYNVSAIRCSSEAGFQALLVWQLSHLFKDRLKHERLYSAFYDVEMPVQRMLAEMEIVGVYWDREYADILWTSVENKLADIQNLLYSLTRTKFNLRSRTDILKVQQNMKSCGEDIINRFKAYLRYWRVLNSLKTRNLSPLLMLEGTRLRGVWETHTATGRISMLEPSLQHVPRDITIDGQVFSLRSAFIAAPGHYLVGADYCQLELRLLAHFSRDACLLRTFSQPGDVFRALAAEWNHLPLDQVPETMRHQTKQLCYGLVYGMSRRSLAEELGVDEIEAGHMVDQFHKKYQGVQSFIDKCVGQCRVRGLVTTLHGRIRPLPDINSQNSALRGKAERQAVNTLVQGSAADISKATMLRVHKAAVQTHLKAHLIINLHDELIYEVENNDVEEFCIILRREMECATNITVPLPVKLKKGPSWGLLEPVD